MRSLLVQSRQSLPLLRCASDWRAKCRCPDFQASAIAAAQYEQFIGLDWVVEDGTGAQWEPEGASYYDNELVITPEQRWTREQKTALLDWHPMFTGRCPHCEVPLPQTEPPCVDWDCACGWRDDSL